ncbi:MAG: hypothetical protein ACRC33_01495 [Gemmataceae bacterium]
MKRLVPLSVAALGLAAALHSRPPGDVESLRVQEAGGVAYFHVRLVTPPG